MNTRRWTTLGVATALALALAGCSSGTTHRSVPRGIRYESRQRLGPIYAQGIAHVPRGWILSGTNVLARTDAELRTVAQVTPAIPPAWASRGFDHVGDIDVVDNVIYAPLEQPDYTKGVQATARYDARTLRFLDAILLPQHENSFVAIDPRTKIAYSMDHFDGRTLLRYDLRRAWKRLPRLRLSMLLRHTQGAAVGDGAVWISTSDDHNGLYRVDLANGHVTALGSMGHPGGEGEGIAAVRLESGYLHTLTVDPAINPVWLDHFTITTTRSGTAPSVTSPG